MRRPPQIPILPQSRQGAENKKLSPPHSAWAEVSAKAETILICEYVGLTSFFVFSEIEFSPKKHCSAGNIIVVFNYHTMRMISTLIGLALALCGVIGSWLDNDLRAVVLLVGPVPQFLAVSVIALGGCILAFGFADAVAMLASAKVFWVQKPAGIDFALVGKTVAGAIGYAYAAGALVFLVNLFSVLFGISGDASLLGRQILDTLFALACTVVLAEFLLRPLKHRLASCG
jgi:hypothetical protein